MNTIRVGLIGVTGYTGMELTRLLVSHPAMRLVMACSRAEAGKKLGEHYPFLANQAGAEIIISQPDAKAAAALCDLVFLAVPHKAAMEMAAELLAAGVKVVDLSADFRIHDASVYEAWYGVAHTQKKLLAQAVYGLPELYAEQTAQAQLVANPGCYPSSIILALHAAFAHDLILAEDIIVDAKSGTTGAGRKAAVTSLYCEVADSFRAYNIGGKHRHTPEIEQELSLMAGKPVVLSFNPHLLPINRGILSTIYTKLKNAETTLGSVYDAYCRTWQGSQWVRVLPLGSLPETRNVRGTMFCDIGLALDERTGRLIVVSAIDNLCRGASGQAIANANILCGLPVSTGLMLAPLMP
jgi:N-acetyl-gamma-glutamyl-phosphate reductase